MKNYILLEIKNFVPTIFLFSEDQKKVLTKNSENLTELFFHFGKTFGLYNQKLSKEENFFQLLEIARRSNEDFFDSFVLIDTQTLEFEFEKSLAKILSKAKELMEVDEYKDIKLNKKLREQIQRDRNSDILASFLEAFYNILIGKVITASLELGISEVHLKDETGNQRLAERMKRETANFAIEFVNNSKNL